MDNQNLFEDLTLEDAKRRLKAISDYMYKAIEERRQMYRDVEVVLPGDKVPFKSDTRLARDITEDEVWNVAHDVLELVYFPNELEPLKSAVEKMIDERFKFYAEHMTKQIKDVLESYVKRTNRDIKRLLDSRR